MSPYVVGGDLGPHTLAPVWLKIQSIPEARLLTRRVGSSSGLFQTGDTLSCPLWTSHWLAEASENHFQFWEENQKWLSKVSAGHSEAYKGHPS